MGNIDHMDCSQFFFFYSFRAFQGGEGFFCLDTELKSMTPTCGNDSVHTTENLLRQLGFPIWDCDRDIAPREVLDNAVVEIRGVMGTPLNVHIDNRWQIVLLGRLHD